MGSRLEGRTAIVTGASRGIGAAIARAMVAEGAQVILVARKAEALEALAAELGPAAHAHPCHVGHPDQIDALMAWSTEHVGLPDVLVNNAATNPHFGHMLSASPSQILKTFEVNLFGALALCGGLAAGLTAAGRRGAIVNVTSVMGLAAAPLQGIYGMTKAALISMTRTLAHELGPANIRVNAIAPGLVDTRFASALTSDPALTAHFTDRAALKRVARPEEIAPLAVHLAGDESSFTTGQVYCADGGWSVA